MNEDRWTFPDWLHGYAHLLTMTTRRPQDIEARMNDRSALDPINMAVKEQVGLLRRLVDRDLLDVTDGALDRGAFDCRQGVPLEACPFTTEKLAEYWRLGWKYQNRARTRMQT